VLAKLSILSKHILMQIVARSRAMKKLSELRKKKMLSQKEMASLIGVPVSTYRGWEYGSSMDFSPIVKLAEVLEISLRELLIGEAMSSDPDKIRERVVQVKSSWNQLEKSMEQFLGAVYRREL
jgi:transcriptional regulator with XRE-family HTH domain